jgi:hypothetical protein
MDTKEADIEWSMGESKRTLSHILERCCDHMPLIIMLKWLARFGKHLCTFQCLQMEVDFELFLAHLLVKFNIGAHQRPKVWTNDLFIAPQPPLFHLFVYMPSTPTMMHFLK